MMETIITFVFMGNIPSEFSFEKMKQFIANELKVEVDIISFNFKKVTELFRRVRNDTAHGHDLLFDNVLTISVITEVDKETVRDFKDNFRIKIMNANLGFTADNTFEKKENVATDKDIQINRLQTQNKSMQRKIADMQKDLKGYEQLKVLMEYLKRDYASVRKNLVRTEDKLDDKDEELSNLKKENKLLREQAKQ